MTKKMTYDEFCRAWIRGARPPEITEDMLEEEDKEWLRFLLWMFDNGFVLGRVGGEIKWVDRKVYHSVVDPAPDALMEAVRAMSEGRQ